MAHIITERVIRQTTEIRCSLFTRQLLENKLKRTQYEQVGLFDLGGDYMIGSKSNDEYQGHVVTVVTADIKRHEKLVNLITGWLVKRGTVKSEIREITEEGRHA